ncbi:MAG: Z1 domain-containing protein [Sulfurovum sp.]|nr:Z1 domain-containing protein [Sulfurovum sp.]
MISSHDKLLSQAMFFLSQNPELKTSEHIRSTILTIAPLYGTKLNEEEVESIAKRIEELYGFSMDEGTLIKGEEAFQEWYFDFKASSVFEPYFWERYKQLLAQKQLPPPVISAIDNVTDKIVGQLENPNKKGHWDRRGMVVGHVQSGKTANFIGVVNKAADSGYKLIIVLAGMLESLRSQTQERIDEGFVGEDSSKKNSTTMNEKLIGVGHINPNRFPLTMTDLHNDFRSNQNFQVSSYDTPTILIVKKNTSVLKRLRDWLQRNNADMKGNISNLPLLMIDDEADHASINTNDEDKNPTAINTRIREILNLFNRKCYLAYTATPFANIFIDPETQDEMLEDDLFPRDFIISLDPPSNYVGSEKIFNSLDGEEGIDIVRSIDDIEDILPLKHKKDYTVPALPYSLKTAVCSHVISKAIRILRGQNNKHHSMLVHVSRYKDVQKSMHSLLLQFKQDLEHNIRYGYKYDLSKAINNQYMKCLFDTWESDFKQHHSDWHQIQEKLLESIASMQVLLINGDSDDSLNYSDYADGMNVIAVGGDRLARGLTLEGLATSYFYRSTSMYDTLMQMGRWFGYRDGFADICRIYLTPMTEHYFTHISNAAEELRLEIKDMFAANLSPKDFGLRVRRHPGTLLITAKNKMRRAQTVIQRTDLNGRLIESYALDLEPSNRQANHQLAVSFVQRMQSMTNTEINNEDNCFWANIDASQIIEFVESYKNHPASHMTSTRPVVSYLKQSKKYFPIWDVVLVNVKNAKNKTNIAGLDIGIQRRASELKHNGEYIEISSRRRVGNNLVERAGMSDEELLAADAECRKEFPGGKKEIPGRFLRQKRTKPLLMLHVVDAYANIRDDSTLMEKELIAYGISFPKSNADIEPVEFAVNTVYVKNHYEDNEDDEE